jgi:neutral ceramidase
MNPTRSKKFIRGLLAVGLLLVLTFLILVGPWPNYDGLIESAHFVNESLETIDRQASPREPQSERTGFLAGWGSQSIAPPIGTPLAGYGARKGGASIGIRDDVFVKALAVGDGVDTAIILGSDLLIVPENVADEVRSQVSEITNLNGNEILFTASHNHSGPGGFAPGIVSGLFNGPYHPEMVGLLVAAFTAAIVEALETMEPASVLGGGVDLPEFIKNRERPDAPVDSELSYLHVEKASGDQCVVVSYSAHPTIIGSNSFEICGEYPGFLMRHLALLTGAEVIYLGGAVGSMGHRAPEASTSFEQSELMGKALADRVAAELEQNRKVKKEAKIDVEVIGASLKLPPYQVRLNRNLRLSKFLLPILGVDDDGWLQGVRMGDIVLIGTPADYSGEISVQLKAKAAKKGIDLWVLSFNGDYVGYISPDAYYNDLESDGSLGYERGTMSWIGPQQEAYTTTLIERLIEKLF